MSDYYHLRIDCPTYDYLVKHLKEVQNDECPYEYETTLEISDKGKRHFHMIILLSEEDVQPLRLYLGGTYKRNLKKEWPHYWEKVYGDSKKIQVYSLKTVRNYKQCKAYIHKQSNTDTIFRSKAPHFTEWREELYNECMKVQVEEEKEDEKNNMKIYDDFWQKFLTENPDWFDSDWSPLDHHTYTVKPHYYYALQKFYDEFGDIKGFRNKFLKSAHKNKIIDFNTYMKIFYRL